VKSGGKELAVEIDKEGYVATFTEEFNKVPSSQIITIHIANIDNQYTPFVDQNPALNKKDGDFNAATFGIKNKRLRKFLIPQLKALKL